MRRRRLPVRHDLLRVLVAQFVEGEGAPPGDRDGLGEQFGRIDRRQPGARAQVPLAVRMERVAAFGERLSDADRRDGVLQRAPGADVHVDVAGGDLRQGGRARERGAPREPVAVAGAGEELDRDPCAAGKGGGDPARGGKAESVPIFPPRPACRDVLREKSSPAAALSGGTHSARRPSANAATSSRESA